MKMKKDSNEVETTAKNDAAEVETKSYTMQLESENRHQYDLVEKRQR